MARRGLRTLAATTVAASLTLGAGCGEDKREALPVPKAEHTAAKKPERKLGRLVEVHAPTIANALAGHSREPLQVRVTAARLGPRYAWLKIEDETGSAWAVVPPIAATPTGTVTLSGWVRQRADDAAPEGAPEEARKAAADAAPGDDDKDLILWAGRITGPGLQPVERAEEAVIDPVFAALEITGTVASARPPEIAPADHSIAALHLDRKRLEGKTVKIRGQVIHLVPDLSGRDWWLLRDGSGDDDPFASGDKHVLLVAANAPITPGEVVLVEGTVLVDRAFTLTGPIPLALMPARVLKDAGAAGRADAADAPETATPADAKAAAPAAEEGP